MNGASSFLLELYKHHGSSPEMYTSFIRGTICNTQQFPQEKEKAQFSAQCTVALATSFIWKPLINYHRIFCFG